jgi:hypothetical protein
MSRRGAWRPGDAMMAVFLNRPTQSLLRTGLLVFGAYLALVVLDAILAYRDVRQWLPPELHTGAFLGFVVPLMSNATGEIVMLGLGWIVTVAMVTIVDGHTDGLRVFAVIALCYAPLLVYPVAVLLALARGVVDASGLAGITDPQLLVARAQDVVPNALAPLKPVRYASLAAAFAMGWFAIRHACRLNGVRAGVVLGTYALFSALVSNFGHE